MCPDASPLLPPDDEEDGAAADEAAAIDDLLGGFASNAADAPAPSGSPAEIASTLDLMLRLRQAAAAEGAELPLPAPGMPARIGRYEVVGLAGRGGFAVVWEALDPLLHRRVAVKTPQPEALLSPTLRRRFLREAEIASRLVHPHIVTIFEIGESDGREFLVEEFCSGGSLAAWLTRHPGPVAPRLAAAMVRALSDAVAYAHGQGVIHRDIKPANVLLCPAPTPEEVLLPDGCTLKLGDFGLGAIHETPSDLTQLTASGARLGTPAWMAPEQIDSSFGGVGPATDIHGLGLLLHRLVTGRNPHDGCTDVEIYRSVLLEEAPSLDRQGKGVPRDLAAVCARCLAKRPADRYSSAAALTADLGRWLAGQPTIARPLSRPVRMLRHLARRRLVVGLCLGLVAALCGAAWIARAWLDEGHTASVQRQAIRHQTAVVELQRAFEAWRTGSVSRAEIAFAKVRELEPALAESMAGRLLQRRLHGERRTLFHTTTEQDVPAYAVAVTPDGHYALAGFADGTLRMMDRAGRMVAEVVQAHDEINDVCISADGRMVATVGQDGLCRWWRVADAGGLAAAGAAEPVRGALFGVAFTADQRQVVTGGEDRVVRVVSLDDGRLERTIDLPVPAGETSDIEAIAPIRGDLMAVACGDRVFVIDASGQAPPTEFEHRRDDATAPTFHSLAVSSDGSLVAAGGSERRARVWSATDGRLRLLGAIHPGWVQGCSFSPDSRQLVTGCRDGLIRVFDVGSGEAGATLAGHAGRIWDVAFTDDGTVISSGGDGSIREWDITRGFQVSGVEEVPIVGGTLDFVEAAVGASDRNRIAVVAGGRRQDPFLLERDQQQRQWRRRDFVCQADARAELADVAMDESGRFCALSFERGHFIVVPLDTSGSLGCMEVPLQSPGRGAVAWSPQGRLVTAVSERRVMLWSPDCNEAREIATIAWALNTVAVVPAGPPRIALAGQRLAILECSPSDVDRQRQADDADAATVIIDVPVREMVAKVAWSPDGERLLVGSRSGAVDVLDGRTGDHLGSLVPHPRDVEAVTWSPDGRVLLSADAAGVRLSDAETLATFDEIRPGWRVLDIAVPATGAWLAISGRTVSEAGEEMARCAIVELTSEPVDE